MCSKTKTRTLAALFRCTLFVVLCSLVSLSITSALRSTFAVEVGSAVTNNHSIYKLQDERGQAVFPISVVKAKNDLYFLGPECLWCCLGAKKQTNSEDILVLKRIEAPRKDLGKVSWQEANDFVYLPKNEILAVVDKSGDIFEYLLLSPMSNHWRVRRANSSKLGPPDPDYISVCELNNDILLCDPERNQIWFQSEGVHDLKGLLPGVLSWKLKPGDINITDAVCIGQDKGQVYLLKKWGALNKYGIKYGARGQRAYPLHCFAQGQIKFNHPTYFRPSRLYLSMDEIYIVERENNRVLKVLAQSGTTNTFLFPADSNLRGLVKAGNGFWIINGDHFIFRAKNNEIADFATKAHKRIIDKRLNNLILPIMGQSLPSHPGVYPGARRLYRYGVHNGLDMFNQPGAKVQVITGTPVRAACSGKIIRADLNYKDMSYATYNTVIRECFEAHQTSAKNADLLRGCQVWIDSGNGLITKYAHLQSANNKLKVGANVKQGDTIGYVGVSGTGENLPGHARYPHLHFEIWLDGNYLGYGLQPAETISLFEDIFSVKNNK